MADTKLSALAEISVPALADFDYTIDAGLTSQKRSISRLGGLLSPLYTTGRLTLVDKNAFPTTDQLAKGTLYYTSITNDDGVLANNFQIVIYDGTRLRAYSSAQISLALTLTSGKNYDVFIYDNAGTLTLELSAAWTNDTTRADALAAQSGLIVKSGTTTRRWIGTIRASATNQTADSGGLAGTTQVGGTRFVWNAYNQRPRSLQVIDTTNTWSYATQTIRQANAASGNKVEWVAGEVGVLLSAEVLAGISNNVGGSFAAKAGIGIDSTTTFSGLIGLAYNANASSVQQTITASYRGFPGLGYHYASWNEFGADGTCTFVGDSGAQNQSGLRGEIWG